MINYDDKEQQDRVEVAAQMVALATRNAAAMEADEQGHTSGEKIALVILASMNVCEAAIHAAIEATKQRGEDEVGQFTLDTFDKMIAPKVAELRKALDG